MEARSGGSVSRVSVVVTVTPVVHRVVVQLALILTQHTCLHTVAVTAMLVASLTNKYDQQ